MHSSEELATLRMMLDAYETRVRARAGTDHVRMVFNVPAMFADRIKSEAATRGWTTSQVCREYVVRGMTAEIEAAGRDYGRGDVIA